MSPYLEVNIGVVTHRQPWICFESYPCVNIVYYFAVKGLLRPTEYCPYTLESPLQP